MLSYFWIKLFPNITTLFYRSQLHVPLYVRNRGWGSRYCGLGILTPTPDFCFWNYKNFSYVSKKCSDIFDSKCFLTRLLYFISHSYMFHCMSGIEGGCQDTVAWASWPLPQTFVFEIIRIQLFVQEMLRYFQIKLFPNKTILFYRSRLHVPLYVRNRGWGARYCGLGILTPIQFYEIRNVVICQRRTQIILGDIFSSIVFSITTLFYQSQ